MGCTGTDWPHIGRRARPHLGLQAQACHTWAAVFMIGPSWAAELRPHLGLLAEIRQHGLLKYRMATHGPPSQDRIWVSWH